ncbi:MAG: hypothetical protein FJ087_18950 [Deltaproteobacteria bacterium]|nr:hypothetical protein [Deltaproteobacteria bacterium]
MTVPGTAHNLCDVRRNTSALRRHEQAERGHCVVCGTIGTSEHDFICADCGDPLGTMLYCTACGRRLALDPATADAFLRDNGYDLDNLSGVVMKVTRCSRCMADDETVDLSIYRLRFG